MAFTSEWSRLVSGHQAIVLHEPTIFISKYAELFAALEGTLSLENSSHPCRTNTVFFLPPGMEVELIPDKHCILLRISFCPEILLALLDSTELFSRRFYIFEENDAFFTEIAAYGCALLEDSASIFHHAALFMPILERLDLPFRPDAYESLLSKNEMTEKQKDTLIRILSYVKQHFEEDISLSSAAEYFSFTPQYLSSFFKKYTGKTFQNYILELRLKKALVFYRFTGLTCEEICQKVRIRQKSLLEDYLLENESGHMINPVSTPSFPVLSAQNTLTYLHQPTRQTASPRTAVQKILVNTHRKTSFPDSWRRLINLGYVSDFTDVRILHQLIRVQEEIGFTYGRLCRIFDFITEYKIDKKIIYDYNRIFRILDVMAENHLVPFLELSNKLFRIHLSLLKNIPKRPGKDSAAHLERVIRLLPDFLCACINRYGREAVKQWRFEISYDIYNFMDNGEIFPLPKYAGYFQRIKKIIRQYIPECQVGGIGFNYWKNPERVLELLSLMKSYRAVPDFFTAYLYPITSDDTNAALSANQNLPIERLHILESLVHSQYPQMEIWITEFNSNHSSRNLLNDSSYQAVFLSKLFTEASQLPVHALGYYLLSDLPLRYADTLDLLFGGWGLFTDTNLEKPSLHAYKLLGRLGNRLLKHGTNYLITTSAENNYQCLFFHYEHPEEAFYRKNISLSDINTGIPLFQHTKAAKWQIELAPVKSGIYLIKEYMISDVQSNLLSEWQKLQFLTPSKEDNIQLLGRLSALVPAIRTQEVSPHEPLTLTLSLSGQSVCLLQIEPLSAAPFTNQEVRL